MLCFTFLFNTYTSKNFSVGKHETLHDDIDKNSKYSKKDRDTLKILKIFRMSQVEHKYK